MPKVALLAKIPVKPGSADDFDTAMSAMFDAVAEEEGTELYVLNWDSDRSTAYVYEVYADSDALAVHSGSDAMQALLAAMGDLVGGEPELVMLDPSAAKGIDL